MNCPNCKAENEGQGTFCRHCGAELPAAPDAPSAVTEVLLPTAAVAPPPPVPAAPPPMPQAAPPPARARGQATHAGWESDGW